MVALLKVGQSLSSDLFHIPLDKCNAVLCVESSDGHDNEL